MPQYVQYFAEENKAGFSPEMRVLLKRGFCKLLVFFCLNECGSFGANMFYSKLASENKVILRSMFRWIRKR
jgi:hypothetical protein